MEQSYESRRWRTRLRDATFESHGDGRRPYDSVPPAIVAALADGPRTAREIILALPWANPVTVQTTLMRMARDHSVVRIGRGVYGCAPPTGTVDVADTPGHGEAAKVRLHVASMRPGENLDVRDLCRDLDVRQGNAAKVVAELEANGQIVRLARCIYAKRGPARGGSADEPARVGSDAHVGRSSDADDAGDRPTGLVRKVLTAGRVWSVEEIAHATSLTIEAVTGALDRLEVDGLACHVIFAHWRSPGTPAILYPNRGDAGMRALADLLGKAGAGTRSGYGEGPGVSRRMMLRGERSLVEAGVAFRGRNGRTTLDPAWLQAIQSRMGHTRKRLALTGADATVVIAMRNSGPWGPDDVAARVSLDAGGMADAIHRLRRVGRIIEVDQGRYMLT